MDARGVRHDDVITTTTAHARTAATRTQRPRGTCKARTFPPPPGSPRRRRTVFVAHTVVGPPRDRSAAGTSSPSPRYRSVPTMLGVLLLRLSVAAALCYRCGGQAAGDGSSSSSSQVGGYALFECPVQALRPSAHDGRRPLVVRWTKDVSLSFSGTLVHAEHEGTDPSVSQ